MKSSNQLSFTVWLAWIIQSFSERFHSLCYRFAINLFAIVPVCYCTICISIYWLLCDRYAILLFCYSTSILLFELVPACYCTICVSTCTQLQLLFCYLDWLCVKWFFSQNRLIYKIVLISELKMFHKIYDCLVIRLFDGL